MHKGLSRRILVPCVIYHDMGRRPKLTGVSEAVGDLEISITT